jgi:hypothetical protein
MATTEQLETIVADLIEVLQLQAKELEKLIAHVEQVTTRLPETNELAVVRSGLAALHVRLRKLRAPETRPSKNANAQ